MKSIVKIYSDVGGSLLGIIPHVANQRMPLQLDHRAPWEFDAYDGDWKSLLTVRSSVLRAELPERGIFEWRFAGVSYGKGQQSGTVKVRGESLVTILRDVGKIRITLPGGGSLYSLGAEDRTARYYLENFSFAYLQALGISWITLGDIEDEVTRLTIKWYGWTPMQLQDALLKRIGVNNVPLEPDLVRFAEGDYRLHLRRVGNTATKVIVADGRNLVAVTRTIHPKGYATVVQGFGGVPEGGTERAGSGLASWEITNIATADITLADRAGADPPVAIDGQYVGNYLRAIDGSLHPIVASSASTQVVTIASASASFAVGDDVEIRKDSFGTLLDEVRDPDVPTTQRIYGSFEINDYRGERNYAPNPFGSDHDNPSEAFFARVDGDHHFGGSTLNIKGVVPADRVIPAGTVVTSIKPERKLYTTTAQATAVAGEAALAITPSLPTVGGSVNGLSDNWMLAVYENPSSLPSRWSDPQAGTDHKGVFYSRPFELIDLVGGTADTDGWTFEDPLVITGLDDYYGTIDGEVYPGDALVGVNGEGWVPIVLPATVQSDGTLTIVVRRNFLADDNLGNRPTPFGVIIMRPRLGPPFKLQDKVLTIISRMHNNIDNTPFNVPIINLSQVAVSPIPGQENLNLIVDVLIRGTQGYTTQGGTAADFSLRRPPRVELYDGTTLVASGVIEEPSLTHPLPAATFPGFGQPQDLSLKLKATVPLNVTRNLTARLYGVTNVNVSGFGHTFVFVRSWMEMVGSEDLNAPAVWGSHATKIRQDENRRLLLHKQIPDEWQMTVRELWARFNVTPPEPKVTLGGPLYLRTGIMGGEGVDFRVVTVDYNVDDPADTRFKVVSRLEEAMQLIDRRMRDLSGASPGSVAGGTILAPLTPGETPTPVPGTGGGGSPSLSGGSIHIATRQTPPVANHRGDYAHETDILNIRQWTQTIWAEILETTRGDLRMALTRAAEMGALYAYWDMQRFGFTTDDNFRRIRIGDLYSESFLRFFDAATGVMSFLPGDENTLLTENGQAIMTEAEDKIAVRLAGVIRYLALEPPAS